VLPASPEVQQEAVQTLSDIEQLITDWKTSLEK
jgi:hypothetical protein